MGDVMTEGGCNDRASDLCYAGVMTRELSLSERLRRREGPDGFPAFDVPSFWPELCAVVEALEQDCDAARALGGMSAKWHTCSKLDALAKRMDEEGL
jgi:hypothetical protein